MSEQERRRAALRKQLATMDWGFAEQMRRMLACRWYGAHPMIVLVCDEEYRERKAKEDS